MRNTLALAAVAAAGAANAEKAPHSQISKVIQLLADMKVQVDNETAKGAEAAEKFENQCISDITGLEGDIKYSTEKAETAAAQKEEGVAKAASYASEAEALAPQIVAADESKKTAAKEQAEKAATFVKEEAELEDAVGMLTQAYSVLKRAMVSSAPAEGEDKTAFLQKQESVTESQVAKAVRALSTVVESTWLGSTGSNSIPADLKSFLQSGTEEELTLRLRQPQAATQAYTNKSDSILTAIQQMQDKAESQLSALREAALKEKHAFELLAQDLTAKSESMTEQMNAAKAHSAEAAANGERAGAELADTEEALKSFKTQLKDTTASCDKYAADWAERKEEAVEESATIQQAVDVLQAKFSAGGAALIQVRSRISMKRGNEFAIRSKASSELRKLSEKFGDFGLLQAAQSAEKDPFAAVLKMINNMIVKLEDEQSAEAAKEGKCKADLKKGKTEVKVKTNQLEKLTARSDKANARVAELGTELQELDDTIRMLKANKATWTKNRNESRTENTESITEAKESIDALNTAIGILEEFYGSQGESLLQTEAKTRKLSDKAEAIIAILETAQQDFEKIRQSTEKSEKDSQENYERQIQEADVSLAKSKALVEGKTSEQASLKVQIGQIDQDLASASEALSAANKYLGAVVEQCANVPMSFEERQSRRANEIEGLRTALTILNGE